MVYHHYYIIYILLESRNTGKYFSPVPFLPQVILHTTKIIVCVHTIFSTYVASQSIAFEKELFARYCQSLIDKLTFI